MPHLDWNNFEDVKTFLIALSLTQARILSMFVPVPIFNASLLPGMLRLAIGAALGLLVAPTLVIQVAAMPLELGPLLLLVAKEAFVGFVLGCIIAVPFWAFEGVGFLVDNQRGASIAATLNPQTGNDSSPMGIFFNQAFIVFVFVSGGFYLILEVLYESFRLWNLFDWWPHLKPESMPMLIEQVMNLLTMALLLSAPVIIAMFLAELGLALMSSFVPQLQVFFMAMPIKSALAVLVLMLYAATLYEYGRDMLRPLPSVVPMLDSHWRTPAGVAR